MTINSRRLARFEPVTFDPGLTDRIAHHAKRLGLSHRSMTSGAGHDAQMLARICPTSMIFVPSVGSISHNPAEHTRKEIVTRLINLLEQGARHGCDLVVFPELALTTFFPRWHFESQQEIDSFFEVQMPGPDTQALFDVARKLKVGFYLGYAEITQEEGRTRRFNTSILVDQSGAIVEV